MRSFRYDIDACAGPGTEGGWSAATGGCLVRVRMFDNGAEEPQPDVCCDLRPDEARELAFCLLACAQHADDQLASMPSSAGVHAGGRPPHADNPQPPKQGEHQA